mmetsp:Transcript_10127/g.24815  ORF Transcript_10127/g.24815 Transcript_10127/m.24815 type:complete len:192 (-) Transcript_10127:88-663(-)
MKLSLSTLIMCASSASIGFANAKRFAGRSPYETTEGLTERRLDEFEMSIPTPTEESPAESIEKILKEKGVDEATIPTIMKALDGGDKMTDGQSREECAAGVKIVFTVAALLPGDLLPGLETLIAILLCGPEGTTTTSTTTPTCVTQGGTCGGSDGSGPVAPFCCTGSELECGMSYVCCNPFSAIWRACMYH